MSKFYRFEFKYQLGPATARFLEKEISRFGLTPDRRIAGGQGRYEVSSLYFDSYDWRDYQDKAGGFLRRKKFRLRIYKPFFNHSSPVWLEIKNRWAACNRKTRLRLSQEENRRFLREGGRFLLEREYLFASASDRREILWNLLRFSAKPRLVVCYQRRAFLNPAENIRITFDSQLEACQSTDLSYNRPMTKVARNQVVMEVKFATIMPFWFKDLTKKYNLKADTFSKYERSLEALRRYQPLPR